MMNSTPSYVLSLLVRTSSFSVFSIQKFPTCKVYKFKWSVCYEIKRSDGRTNKLCRVRIENVASMLLELQKSLLKISEIFDLHSSQFSLEIFILYLISYILYQNQSLIRENEEVLIRTEISLRNYKREENLIFILTNRNRWKISNHSLWFRN